MKNKKYSKIIFWVVAAIIFFAAWKGCQASKGDGKLEIVRAVKVNHGDLMITVSSTGEVKPYNRVEIKPPIPGRIEEVLVKEGDEVKQGQLIAWMSSTERAAVLDAARSQGAEVYKKWMEAYKPAPLTAPLDGTVIVRAVEPGQTVTAADPVAVISDKLIVRALVDETDLARIRVGQETEIILDAYREKPMMGLVDHISYESQLINNVNVYEVDIIPEEIPPAFRSGMTANITFLVEQVENALLIPAEAVAEWPRKTPRPEGAEFAVYKKDFGKLKPIPVTTGRTDGRMIEIKTGLKEGDEIQIVRKKQSKPGGSAFSPMGGRGGPGGGGGARSRP